ncbi:hypothetical protein E2C01_093351 [Portunus trituberculatus]|uniref:Uncharacterized protein n=1 Tax=Portunus trituberculatus TaxID=210409 RepID=A0A5B7JPK1_PORTR|nr:hypothetical protein [Portunus trituberculatus]
MSRVLKGKNVLDARREDGVCDIGTYTRKGTDSERNGK